MTSNNAPVPFVASASTEYGMGLDAFDAFEGNVGIGQYWLTSAGNPTGWLKIDMGSGNTFVIHQYEIQVNSVPEPNRAPKDWTLQGSNNDSDWTTIDTVAGETAWGNAEKRLFSCDDVSTAYRYFKVVVTANNGDANYLQIAELFLWGCP